MQGSAWETPEDHTLQRAYAHSWPRALGSVGLTAGYYYAAYRLIAGLLAQAWAASGSWHGLILVPAWLGVAALAAKWCLLAWVWGPQEPVFPTVEVTASSQPKLYATLRSLARELDAELPDCFELAAYPNAYSCPGYLYGISLPFQMIGVGIPLFSILGAAELRAILGHELGHRKHREGRPWLSQRLGHQFNFYRGVVGRTKQATIQSSPYHWYCRAQVALLWPFGGQEELEADRSAVRAMDHGTYALALQRIAQAQVLFRDFLAQLPAGRSQPGNVFQAFREHVQGLTAVDLEAALARYRDFDHARLYNGRCSGFLVPEEAGFARSGCGIMPISPLDSHPVLEERVEYLREVQKHYSYRSTKVRGTLYRPDEETERSMTRALFARPGWRNELPAVPGGARSDATPAQKPGQGRLARIRARAAKAAAVGS